jgi:hypothetical protein
MTKISSIFEESFHLKASSPCYRSLLDLVKDRRCLSGGPLLLDCPASVPRGESSDKGQRVLPLIGVMLPVIGGLSVTPFSSSRRWPGNPICTPLGRLKWQFRLALAARSHAIRWPRLWLTQPTPSLLLAKAGCPTTPAGKDVAALSAKRPSPVIKGSNVNILKNHWIKKSGLVRVPGKARTLSHLAS